MTAPDDAVFPLPDVVAGYGDRPTFDGRRPESGQWVFWEDRVNLVLEGRYRDVVPLHVELSPTYLCNFACPWCSCRTAREDWSDEDVFNHPSATPRTVMSRDRLDAVLHHLAQHRTGIMWVGGEPTMHQLLYPAALRANELGMQQCLFTNGSLLSGARIETLLDAELVFIRVSLDAATEEVHQIHHGYAEGRPYSKVVKENLAALTRRRIERRASTMIAVSIVVDERNLADLMPTASYLVSLCEQFGDGAIDYVIVRPTYQFYAAQLQLRGDTRSKIGELVAAGSELREALEQHGVRVVAPEASFADPDVCETGSGRRCLAAPWFSEVTANGDMVVCSDRYGNPDYFIGNIATTPLEEIWSGDKRREVFERVDTGDCFQRYCPRNGRGFQLNRVFHQIEELRLSGRIDDVRRWIRDLQGVLPRPAHPFFL